MKRLILIITLPLRMLIRRNIEKIILLEIESQLTEDFKDEYLEDFDTKVWLKAFDDQHILKTTKNYLEHCYEQSKF